MPSHAAEQVLGERSVAPGRLEATLRLACGCRVTRTLPDDRILDGEAGARYAVGKFPCPAGHPVGHRPARTP
ncbi:MAG: hypothetical protein NVS4B10_18130 [Myxococcales bacterium]